MKTLAVASLILLTAAVANGQEPAVVLYIQTLSIGSEPGTMDLVLKSGTKLTVKIADIDTAKTTGAVRAANKSMPASNVNAASTIRAGCQKEWGTDFKM